MKIEQLQYFAEAARTGSISTAAKNLFISHQGISDALLRLEEELGFPLFIREKRGVSLTTTGEVFYAQVLKLLEIYRETLHCAYNLERTYKKQKEKLTLTVNPLFSPVIINAFSEANLTDAFRLYESSINDSINALQDLIAQLSIILVPKQDLPMFTRKLPSDLEAIELFEDEIMACLSKNSSFSQYDSIDSSDPSITFIEYSTTYYDYFKVTSNLPTSIISNDASLHLKMMKYNNAVSITTSKLLRAMYPNDNDIIAKSYSSKTYCKFYLLRNKTVVDSNIDQATELIKSIVQKIIAD